MALTTRQRPVARGRLLITLMTVFALAVQPVYGLLAARIAAATTMRETIIVAPASSLTIKAGETAKVTANTSGYSDLQLSFHYNIQELEPNKHLTYAWEAGVHTAIIGSIEGEKGAKAGGIGDVTDVMLPVGASVDNLALSFINSGISIKNDTVKVENVRLTGIPLPPVPVVLTDTTPPSVPRLVSPIDRGYSRTNDFYFDWDDSTDNNPGVTYEFQSSLNPHTTSGILDTDVWKSEVLPTSTIHSTGAPDGTWYWQVRAIDAAGNKSDWTKPQRVTLDTKAPAGSISAPVSGGTLGLVQTNGIITVKGAASDNLGLNRVLVQLLTNRHGAIENHTVYLSGTNQDWSTDFDASGLGLASGSYAVVASFTDNAGNVYRTEYTDFWIDTTAPSTFILKGVQSGVNKVRFEGTVADAALNYYYCYLTTNQTITVGGITYTPGQEVGARNADCVTKWANGQTNFDGELGSFDMTDLPAGTYTINLVAYDTAGNNTASDPATYQINFTREEELEPPVAAPNLVTSGTPQNGSEDVTSDSEPVVAAEQQIFTNPIVAFGGQDVLGSQNQSNQNTTPNSDISTSNVLGEQDKGQEKGTPLSDTGEVLGIMDHKLFGVAWYWYLVVPAILIGGWLVLAAAIRRNRAQE